MRALFPVSNCSQGKMEPRRELLLGELQLFSQSTDGRHTMCLCKLRRSSWRTVPIMHGGLMAILFAHGIEGTPIRLRELLRVQSIFRDISFFHAALLLSQRCCAPCRPS